jgi:branched-chain amino acid transport system permease protein
VIYRQAHLFHTSYTASRALFPVPADRWMVIALLLGALSAPLTMGRIQVSTIVLPWLIWTAIAMGLNLIVGWAGQFHLGYGAIVGVGAYASIHAARAGLPWELAVVVGGLTATVMGTVFAFAALRVKGLYLALSTLALQYVVDWILYHVPAISGGAQASMQAPPLKLLGQVVASETGLYYVALAWCLIVTTFMLNVRRTALGRALVAVREKDYAAAVIGVNSAYYKLLAFATSSFIGGVGGAILIFTFYRAVTPEQFAVNVSIEVLAMVIVGGLGSVIGSYLGSAFVLLMPGYMNRLVGWLARLTGAKVGDETLAHIPYVFYGGLIIFFLLVEPMGLGKLYQNVRSYLVVWPFRYARK